MTMAAEVRGSFQETEHRKTAENTVKHRDGDVGLVVANHHGGGGESSMVVTTLVISANEKSLTGLNGLVFS